jgi:hypothetical protein
MASIPQEPVELKVGDKVAHIGMGDGVITSIEEDGVHVTYERGRTIGIYNENWFKKYPKYLFKRSKP